MFTRFPHKLTLQGIPMPSNTCPQLTFRRVKEHGKNFMTVLTNGMISAKVPVDGLRSRQIIRLVALTHRMNSAGVL